MSAPSIDHARALDLVERHFAGKSDAESEALLREHLGGCESCTAAYDRFRLFSLVDPSAPQAKDRLGAALGLAPKRARHPFAWPGLAMTIAAAAAVFLVVRPAGDDEGFVARGADKPKAASLSVFRSTAGGAPAAVTGAISANDEVAFAYTNPKGRTHLLVFGVDEHQHVHWYHPAWTDADKPPSAVPAKKSDAPVELPDAIRHDLDGKTLTLTALFVDRAVSVLDVEAAVAARKTPLVAAADVVVVPLVVERR